MSSTQDTPPDPGHEIAGTADTLFRALIEHNTDAVSLLDARGRLIYTSPATERILGYTTESLSRHALPELMHPDDRENALDRFRAALRQPNQRIEVEARIRHANGSWRWIANVITNRLDDPGVRAIVINSRDTTESREIATELRTSRDQLQAILQGAADGITVQDMHGRILYANEAAARLIGFPSVQSLLDAQPGTLLQRFRVFDEAGAPFDLGRLPGRVALEERRTEEVVLRYEVVASGEVRWSNVRATPVFDPGGAVMFAVTAFQDITRVKQSEAAMRYLAEISVLLASSLDFEETLRNVTRLAVPALADICVVDLLDDDGNLRRFAVWLGEGKDPRPAWEIEEKPLNREAAYGPAHVLRSGVSELVTEITDEIMVAAARDAQHLELLRSVRPKSHMIVPLRSRGRVLGLVTFLSSESGRHYGPQDLALAEELADRATLAMENAQLYREAQEALAKAQSALASRDQFITIASHEFRTPLTALRGQLQLSLRRLRRGYADGVEADLVAADRQANRLGLLVNQLLDVSRLDAGQFAIVPQPLDLRLLLQRAVETARAIEPARVFEVTIADAVPNVEADPARMEQVVVNLLENARKYSPRDRPIHVSLEQSGGAVKISVRDHGIGVPPEAQATIFERFSRAGNVGSAVVGLGVGLYLAAQIVKAHGGTLAIESTSDEGSTFVVTLPLDGLPVRQP